MGIDHIPGKNFIKKKSAGCDKLVPGFPADNRVYSSEGATIFNIFLHCIPDRCISAFPALEHPSKHRYIRINIIIDDDLLFSIMQPMKTPGILGESTPP